MIEVTYKYTCDVCGSEICQEEKFKADAYVGSALRHPQRVATLNDAHLCSICEATVRTAIIDEMKRRAAAKKEPAQSESLPFDDTDEYFAEISKYSEADQIESLKERIVFMKAALDHANRTLNLLAKR